MRVSSRCAGDAAKHREWPITHDCGDQSAELCEGDDHVAAMKPSAGKSSGKRRRAKSGPSYDPARIVANAHPIYTKVRGGWFAAYWNMIALTWAAISTMELDSATWWLVIWFPPAIGVGLATIAVRHFVRLRRDGAAVLRLDPPGPRIGGPIRISVLCDRPPTTNRIFTIQLRCTAEEHLEDGMISKVRWKGERRMIWVDSIAEAHFDMPGHLPPTDARWDVVVNYRWSVVLDRGGYTREYDIVVQASETV